MALVHTPAYLLSDNVQVRKISARWGPVDQEGSLNVDCSTSYKALCQDEIESIIHGMSKTDQLVRLKSEFNLPTYDVLSFDYKEDHSKRLPVIYENIRLNVNNYAQITGKRIFINPDILTKANEKMSEEKNRRFGIELKNEYKHIDSIQISIPPGYVMESRPTDLELSGLFGKYSSRISISAAEDHVLPHQRTVQRAFFCKRIWEFCKVYKCDLWCRSHEYRFAEKELEKPLRIPTWAM